jgi:Domain of unknown function (DUF4159)/Aerotolerance regulator N-terminal
MTLGALTFLSPWLLTGLVALPIIYWLLRTVPPRPRQIVFPPTRILVGLENREKTPDKTPWWLMLIRLLAAALIIFALAQPILNPNRSSALSGGGPVAIVVDNGWAAGAHWPERVRLIKQLISQAEAANRPIVVVGTADPANLPASIEAPNDARTRAAALTPHPYPPLREAAAARVANALRGKTGVSVVWLTDAIDHGAAQAFIDRMAGLSLSEFIVVEPTKGTEPLGLFAGVENGGKLKVDIVRTGGAPREGIIFALSARGERLSEARYKLANGAAKSSVAIELPLELRNQVSRMAIAAESSAAAVYLLDARSKWSRVGLIAGTEADRDQPLLGPLYYVRRALAPYAELVEPNDANLATGLIEILKRRPSTLILADVGTIPGDVQKKIAAWVDKGGVLIRFAGPRLEEAGDELLPVPLRSGGRALGGALSWSTPQPLAPFSETSAFAGLDVPKEVKIQRQVLADPAKLDETIEVWARLQDGTPLVTAARKGEGRLVLFHVTANSSWSNLPLSGLFVEMLRRVSTMGTLANSGGGQAAATTALNKSDAGARTDNQAVLPPVQVLDGLGALRPPPPTASPIPLTVFAKTRPGLEHPPGYYGPAGRPRALNLITDKTVLKALPGLPAMASVRVYEDQASTDLKPWLLAAGLALLLIDVIAILLLQAGGIRTSTAARTAAQAAIIIGFAASLAMFVHVPLARAQVTPAPPGVETAKPGDAAAIAATGRVTFGYVLTGDAGTDGTSRAGLSGLGKVLTARTAVEPGEPVGVDIEKDEIAFYPILYWPVLDNAKTLSTKTLGKIDAYMKQGGMIIFDTRDYGQGLPIGLSRRRESGGETPLQRLLGNLDIPRLEPVPQGHVLTKSFYLLRTFPGRWDGGQLWVEAGGGANLASGRRARRADGVSSILVTPNDFASAWALDERNTPLFPVVPGGERQREMAFRVGVNIVMYALTGNYKADQVHVPALLERLGQ